MLQSNYTLQRDQLLNHYINELQIRGNDYLNGQLQMVSAGLVNYLPDIPVENHEELFKQVLLHKKLSILEQSDYEVLDYVQTEGLDQDLLNLIKVKPVVICTFHTGSYRVLNLFLCKHNVPYTLVTSKGVKEKDGNLFSKLLQKLPGHSSTDVLPVIDAEAANSSLQMLRALKSGRSLVLYIDGNTGSGTATTKNENSCVVDFLNQQLYARKGIAFLAHLAEVPLLSVASYRTSSESICLKFFEPIFPDKTQPRDVFATSVTQFIYKQAEPVIKQYPEQWEAWLYIHKVAKIIHVPIHQKKISGQELNDKKICFDYSRFGIFRVNAQPFLLKKHTYTFYEISTQLYDSLILCADFPIEKKYFDSEQVRQLQMEGVLRYV